MRFVGLKGRVCSIRVLASAFTYFESKPRTDENLRAKFDCHPAIPIPKSLLEVGHSRNDFAANGFDGRQVMDVGDTENEGFNTGLG